MNLLFYKIGECPEQLLKTDRSCLNEAQIVQFVSQIVEMRGERERQREPKRDRNRVAVVAFNL